MRRDQRGMALIFDAMAFLTIITIVSVTLLQAFSVDSQAQGVDQYVADVHRSTLGCTFEEEAATAMTLKDVIVSSVMRGDDSTAEAALAQLDALLRSYLSPEYRYCWVQEYRDFKRSIGDLNVLGSMNAIYCSSIICYDSEGRMMTLSLSVAR